MQRHPSLHPLSRDHHQVLVLARRCERARDRVDRARAADLWRRSWEGWLAAHLELEERVLGPFLDDDRNSRLVAEHEVLRAGTLALDQGGDLPELGRRLREHVRWEERELFPWLERNVAAERWPEIEARLAEGAGASCLLPPPRLEVVPLTPDLRGEFERLHAPPCAEEGCRCTAWWVPSWDEWARRGEEDHRRLREELFARGVSDGYLALAAGAREERAAVGWCQAGPRDQWPRVRSELGLAPDPGTFAVLCLRVDPRRRRRGVARALVGEVVRDLLRRGARRIEAYPARGAPSDPGDLWTGPRALYTELGFRPTGQGSERREVLALEGP